MMNQPRATATPIFWDVDTQRDFVETDGELYVPGAETIVPNLKRVTRWADANGARLISSVCAHSEGDPEFVQYGRHCVVGTPGQQKIPETLLPNRFVIPNHPIELPQDLDRFRQIIIEKDKLDVFTNPNV